MSKLTVKDRLLVSGQTSNPELVAIQLECKRSGLRLDKSGQFGIGVLSYFMIADHVVFRTRPSQKSDPPDNRGWEFETWGVGSFGELRPVEGLASGTEVELDLRKSFVESICGRSEQWGVELFRRLTNFVLNMMVWCPCALEITSSVEGCEPIRIGPGWVEGTDALGKRLCQKIDEDFLKHAISPLDPSLSVQETEERGQSIELAMFVRTQLPEALRWWAAHEGALPNGMGTYRIVLPYFEMPGGACLAFLFVNEADDEFPRLHKVGGNHAIYPLQIVDQSSMGFRISLVGPEEPQALYGSCQVALNITDNASLDVNVNRLQARLGKSLAGQIESSVADQCRRIETEFLGHNQNSRYAGLNSRILHRQIPASVQWATFSHAEQLSWQPVSYPCAVAKQDEYGAVLEQHYPPYQREGWVSLAWRGESVHACCEIQLWRGTMESLPIAPFDPPPDFVVEGLGEKPFPICLWTGLRVDHTSAVAFATMPPEWSDVIAIVNDFGGQRCLLVNAGHSCARFARHNVMSWTLQILNRLSYRIDRRSIFPLDEDRKKIRADIKSGFDWLLACLISGKADEVWPPLKEQDPGLIPELWEQLELGDEELLIAFDLTESGLILFGDVRTTALGIEKVHPYYRGVSALISQDWRLSRVPFEPASSSERHPPTRPEGSNT